MRRLVVAHDRFADLLADDHVLAFADAELAAHAHRIDIDRHPAVALHIKLCPNMIFFAGRKADDVAGRNAARAHHRYENRTQIAAVAAPICQNRFQFMQARIWVEIAKIFGNITGAKLRKLRYAAPILRSKFLRSLLHQIQLQEAFDGFYVSVVGQRFVVVFVLLLHLAKICLHRAQANICRITEPYRIGLLAQILRRERKTRIRVLRMLHAPRLAALVYAQVVYALIGVGLRQGQDKNELIYIVAIHALHDDFGADLVARFVAAKDSRKAFRWLGGGCS